ncbi:MAG: hypothetical protein ABIP13_06025, partial [Tepidiformaceae bacterium]
MGGAWFNRHDPWFAAFILSAGALVASLIALLSAFYPALGGEHTPLLGAITDSAPGVAPTLSPNISLTYVGPLPARLAGASLKPADGGKKADLTFVPNGEDALVTRRFVLISALGTGVDELNAAQADSLLHGGVADWSAVGGLRGGVTRAAVVSTSDSAGTALLADWMGNLTDLRTFASYPELRAAMTIGSGMVAIVPLSEVRVGQPAFALDGADLVRGRGDLATWPYTERVA